MAHFPPAFLDEVLNRTDLVRLIERHVPLKRSGSNLMGLCPFHNEKSPSFSVSADKQMFYCFGCGKGGGAFQFLMDHDGYSFPEAVEYLAEVAGLEVPKDSQSNQGDSEKRKRAHALIEQVADIFARRLHSPDGTQAQQYLQKRQLPEHIMDRYKLGFAPDGYGFMEHCFGKDGRTMAQLEAVGLLFKNDHGGYGDRFRGRLMFPIRDRRGNMVGFGGRVIGNGEPKYLNSPETEFFHKSELLYGYAEHRDEIRRRKTLLVVEGYMDVLALATHGLPIALAPLGTAIGEGQLREILRLTPAPVFCFDGDRAGKQAAWRALERILPLLQSEHSPRFLYLPNGEDPDSLLQKEGPEKFTQRMEHEAKPIIATWLEGLRNIAGQGAEGRARMAKKADAMLAAILDPYLRQAWQQEAEKSTGIALKGSSRSPASPIATAKPKNTAIRRPPRLKEEKFFMALLQQPERFRKLPTEAMNYLFDDEGVHALYIRAFSIAGSEATKNIVGALSAEFNSQQERIARWMNQEPVSDTEFECDALDMHIAWLKHGMKHAPLTERVRLQAQLKNTQHELKAKLEHIKSEV